MAVSTALGTTISISLAHFNYIANQRLMGYNDQPPFNVWDLVDKLHDVGYSVRINATLMRHALDTWDDIETLIEVCKDYKVEQLTLRCVEAPEKSENQEVWRWVQEHKITEQHDWGCDLSQGTLGRFNWSFELQEIEILRRILLSEGAVELLRLPHGAIVYDYKGQNVCLNNCLTSTTDPNEIRQLIYFPDGHLRYDWKYNGAIIF